MKFLNITLVFCIIYCSCSTKETGNPANGDYPIITVPEGFEATMLYSPTEHGQGSWVSLTYDDNGRLITSDQYGRLYRITLEGAGVTVDSINLNIGSAQGLLWKDGGLFVSVNARPNDTFNGSGVYRITDSDGDDELDDVKQLISLEGEGEHGPHAIIEGPDGKSLYLIAGNHTLVPENSTSILNANWKEDRLYPAILDPRGHANNIKPPGGWIARSDDDGQSWNVIASGFRNAYDIAFNVEGELFTYDSDMEWDLGSPWYRPTRVCHVIPGAEFGWRTGSGKWPAYYPDNLPPVIDIGQGSPTGITFGYGAKFPAEYQSSLYISDWSFGTIYKVDLSENGASYSAKKSEFLSGTPLAITDLVIAPDGNMYFTTGGRRGTSYLYRVRYTGNAATDPVQMASANSSARTAMHALMEPAVPLDEIWNGLSSDDRFIRYSARVALEKHPADSWLSKLEAESQPSIIFEAAIAAAHSNDVRLKNPLLSKLKSVDPEKLDLQSKLALVRVYALIFSRLGAPDNDIRSNLPAYPGGNAALDREMSEMLVYLDHAEVIEPTLTLMEQAEATIEADLTPVDVLERSEQYGPTIKAMHENRPAEQGIALARALSHQESGWTPELRERYFRWFYRALQKSGGWSYIGFVERIRLEALDQVPADERKQLAEISGEALLNQPSYDSNVPPPSGPGKNWQISMALEAVNGQLEGKDLKRGEELYKALLCASCHSMDGLGGNVGPDLTQAGTRFSNYDLLMAMISPSMSISDQYAATLFALRDGNTVVGRTTRTTDDTAYVNVNPFGNDEISIAADNIESQVPSPVSLMPGGLINSLNDEELRQLMAYLSKSRNDSK
ncbi:c-type cytochrome [Fulvivirga sedimenti]|uniref:C-type cytochrome n=1 Tax=Fulvivirga sedimenti TaxID=2879465 RepID=A0A9X1HS93_9BACT|nr:c-type cytochrome [Fulvivirga sedimenti]MCA6075108.1 c-type cytochrome [Fulvivirga sedimenti]MCA6076285.1 c-type cytochrome [Fulvivirga sedimenti]MCA6077413.1 c-type cytochrome [Fulvivirga sedimenti]